MRVENSQQPIAKVLKKANSQSKKKRPTRAFFIQVGFQ